MALDHGIRPFDTARLALLSIAVHRGQIAAAMGQVVRIVVGAIGSAVGRVPVGNTGGSDVNMFRRMPIPPDLLEVMEGAAHSRNGAATPAS